MQKTLFVVAHRAGARLVTQHGARFDSVEEIDHPTGRLKNIDHDTDRPGRTHDAGGRRAGLSRHETAHDQDAIVFARALADRVSALRIAHAYDSAVLVAEPGFLGILRAALDETTAKTVRATLTKDLSGVETRDLNPHLSEAPR